MARHAAHAALALERSDDVAHPFTVDGEPHPQHPPSVARDRLHGNRRRPLTSTTEEGSNARG
jgi:hypothetical protein